MKIRVLGAGFYGCHIALALMRDGHHVAVHEIAGRIFAGASGAIPARLHVGCHYPRSRMTRAACQEHNAAFMSEYGFLTRNVPVNPLTGIGHTRICNRTFSAIAQKLAWVVRAIA